MFDRFIVTDCKRDNKILFIFYIFGTKELVLKGEPFKPQNILSEDRLSYSIYECILCTRLAEVTLPGTSGLQDMCSPLLADRGRVCSG